MIKCNSFNLVNRSLFLQIPLYITKKNNILAFDIKKFFFKNIEMTERAWHSDNIVGKIILFY